MAPPQRFYPTSWGFHPSGGCTAQLFNQGVRPAVSGARRSGRRGRRSEGGGVFRLMLFDSFRYVFGGGVGSVGWCVWVWGCLCGAMPWGCGCVSGPMSSGCGCLRSPMPWGGLQSPPQPDAFGRGNCPCRRMSLGVRSRPRLAPGGVLGRRARQPARCEVAPLDAFHSAWSSPRDTRRGAESPRPMCLAAHGHRRGA